MINEHSFHFIGFLQCNVLKSKHYLFNTHGDHACTNEKLKRIRHHSAHTHLHTPTLSLQPLYLMDELCGCGCGAPNSSEAPHSRLIVPCLFSYFPNMGCPNALNMGRCTEMMSRWGMIIEFLKLVRLLLGTCHCVVLIKEKGGVETLITKIALTICFQKYSHETTMYKHQLLSFVKTKYGWLFSCRFGS